MIIDSWLELDQQERSRRKEILRFLADSDESFFALQYKALRFLYGIGELSASEAQMQSAPDAGTKDFQDALTKSSWKEGDLHPSSCFLTEVQANVVAQSTNAKALSELSRNLVVSQSVLTKLANSEDINVLIGVAGNPNTPKEILASMATGDDPFLAGFAMNNVGLPSQICSALLQDKKLKKTRFQVLANWSVPQFDYMVAINEGSPRFEVVCQGALNPFLVLPDWTLDQLVETLENPKTSSNKAEVAEEGIYNLVKNPGVNERHWQSIQKRCDWLLTEYPHLKVRPKISL